MWHAGALNIDGCMQYLDALTDVLDTLSGEEFEQFAASSKDA